MPTEMLKQLAQQTLPINVESIAEVDKIRVLRAAGLIMALFMKNGPEADCREALCARVLAITAEGRTALKAIDRAEHDRG